MDSTGWQCRHSRQSNGRYYAKSFGKANWTWITRICVFCCCSNFRWEMRDKTWSWQVKFRCCADGQPILLALKKQKQKNMLPNLIERLLFIYFLLLQFHFALVVFFVSVRAGLSNKSFSLEFSGREWKMIKFLSPPSSKERKMRENVSYNFHKSRTTGFIRSGSLPFFFFF